MTDCGNELHDHCDGALAHQRDGHRVGADAVGRDAAGGCRMGSSGVPRPSLADYASGPEAIRVSTAAAAC